MTLHNFLYQNSKLIKMTELERRAYLPAGVLTKWINGTQMLSKNHYGILINYLKNEFAVEILDIESD